MFQSVAFLAEGNQSEVAVAGGHVGLVAHFDERLAPQPIGNHVADGDDFHAPFLGHHHQFRQSGHGAVFVHDFHEGAGGVEPGHAAKVDGGLGVARASQNAVVLGIERIDVARTTEGLRRGGGVGQCADGGGAVVDGNARGTAFELVDGNGEGRSEYRRIVLHLMRQVEFATAAQRDGCAEHSACVFQHEVHHFGRDFLGGADEVALVFAVFVIDHDDEFSLLKIYKGFFDGVQFDCVHV